MAARKKKNLVIVESPAKAKTINKYLGPDFEVVASKGHVRDLPKSRFGIDIEDGWVPTYRPLQGPQGRARRAEEAGRQGRTSSTWRPTPTAKARRSPGTSRKSLGLDDDTHPPRHLQRDHQDARCRRRSRTPARSTWTASPPRKRAASSTASSATSSARC